MQFEFMHINEGRQKLPGLAQPECRWMLAGQMAETLQPVRLRHYSEIANLNYIRFNETEDWQAFPPNVVSPKLATTK